MAAWRRHNKQHEKRRHNSARHLHGAAKHQQAKMASRSISIGGSSAPASQHGVGSRGIEEKRRQRCQSSNNENVSSVGRARRKKSGMRHIRRKAALASGEKSGRRRQTRRSLKVANVAPRVAAQHMRA
jgi:hypothetical protein